MTHEKESRNWIFITLFIIGLVGTIVFVASQTNIFYKHSDFDITVMFDSESEGDSGYITIQRHQNTPSTADWVTFGNNESKKFFSTPFVREKLNIEIPSKMDRGVYYFVVEAKYLSGHSERKVIKFRVI